MHCFSTFVPQIGYLSTFPRSGVAQAAFVARGLLKQPEYLSSLGGCRSSFRRSGLPEKNPRAAFVARGLPEQLFSLLGLPEQPSSLGDCPNTLRRSGIARISFVARGLHEQLSSLRAGSSNFFSGYFLLPSDYLILPGFISIVIHQMVSTWAKRCNHLVDCQFHNKSNNFRLPRAIKIYLTMCMI
jgi:hypothetical protein